MLCVLYYYIYDTLEIKLAIWIYLCSFFVLLWIKQILKLGRFCFDLLFNCLEVIHFDCCEIIGFMSLKIHCFMNDLMILRALMRERGVILVIHEESWSRQDDSWQTIDYNKDHKVHQTQGPDCWSHSVEQVIWELWDECPWEKREWNIIQKRNAY